MSDEQLRRYFVTSGLSREVERRKLALENREGNEILVRIIVVLMIIRMLKIRTIVHL